MDLPTEFLPAPRVSAEEVARQSAQWASSEMANMAHILPFMLLAANAQRQIVFTNKPFLEFVGLAEEEVLGLRPGESLGCVHAAQSQGGCGTTRFCRFCGLAKAVVASLEGDRGVQECRINRGPDHQFKALNLQVWTSPLTLREEPFALVSLLDVYQEERLKLMERLFFHDVLNSASGVHNLAEILNFQAQGAFKDTTEMMLAASARLQDQIMAQRDFVLAEDGDMAVSPGVISTRWVLDQVKNFFQRQAILGRSELILDQASPDLSFTSDPGLLLRVLVNLTKNALEACASGEQAVLGVFGDQDGVTFVVRNPAHMNEEVQSQVFKRLFSTKGPGRGLGSYGARLLTERYLGGQIWFSSTSEEGTDFQVWLPKTFAPAEAV